MWNQIGVNYVKLWVKYHPHPIYGLLSQILGCLSWVFLLYRCPVERFTHWAFYNVIELYLIAYDMWIPAASCPIITVFRRKNEPDWINMPHNFWLWQAISERTEPILIKFSAHTVMVMWAVGAHTASFIEIRQGQGFILCLHAQRVYSVKYGILGWRIKHNHVEPTQ